MQTIALHTDADNDEDDNDKVTLMSVHSAKGLEFMSVFVVGLEDNLFPSFMSRENPEGIDEERRLFYVAVTRAERYLTLSYTQSRYRFGKLDTNIEPSRFLTEINEEHLELSGVYNKRNNMVSFDSSSNGGNRTASSYARARKKTVNPEHIPDFDPVHANLIREDLRVVHKRFGAGKVLALSGAPDNRIATIQFDLVGEKKIMLKYAKLGIENKSV